jgi:hypothetical protein
MMVELTLAHLSHWYWQLLAAGPFVIGGMVLLLAQFRARRDGEAHGAEVERRRADQELDEILRS